MTLERQQILIDIDDTFLKSSEEIIRQLNKKNNTKMLFTVLGRRLYKVS